MADDLFYEEATIYSSLCFRDSPDGEWEEVSQRHLSERLRVSTHRLATIEDEKRRLRRLVESLHDAWTHAWVDVTEEHQLPPGEVVIAAASLGLPTLELPRD